MLANFTISTTHVDLGRASTVAYLVTHLRSVQVPKGKSVMCVTRRRCSSTNSKKRIEVAREFPTCSPGHVNKQGNKLHNPEIDTRLDTSTCEPESGKTNNMFDSDSVVNIQETQRVKPLCLEEVLRIITRLEDPPSDLSKDLLHPCIFAVQQHSDDNSEPEQASDSESEVEVETLCEPAVSQPAVPTDTIKPSQTSFLPHILQGKPLTASFVYKLATRRIFKPGNGSLPEKTSRIPISVWIFGVKLNGILDTGSERSYMNGKVYEDVKHLAAGELQEDQTKKGVLLANHSTCKSKGGAPFIIQIGSVAGEQYLSVLPDLGYSLVLGVGLRDEIRSSNRLQELHVEIFGFSRSLFIPTY
ncbi:hypothetical protein KQX54_012101 [Cotesia glomerata]|uniref:Peptidase A2 domain-containing protein n=1 Tax=Cotesia glomerata TaxID=32391 RepID=A0AAV7IHR3_COTGL|nr:hypothetical protein KQX54_012101 [Cotesia glomerata]